MKTKIFRNGTMLIVAAATMLTMLTGSVSAQNNKKCTISGVVTPGLRDVGYMVYVYDAYFDRMVETKKIDVKNGEFELTTNYPEARNAIFQAIFDDGSLCNAVITVVLMPGEHGEMKVKNGQYELTGSTFYRQYSDADDLVTNANRYYTTEERQKMIHDYLIEHRSDEGCAYYYIDRNIYPKDQIISMIDPAVVDGRLANMFKNNRLSRIKPAATVAPKSDHYTRVDGLVSQGIKDVGYVIDIYDADFENIVETRKVYAKNNEYTIFFDFEEPRLAVFAAIFPDSTICTATVPIMLVPGESAKLKVMNGTFNLSGGSNFYKQYNMAEEACGNMRNSKDREKYLKEHGNEDGCVMAYIYSQMVPQKTILENTSPEVKTGRFHRLFDTKHYGMFYRKVN